MGAHGFLNASSHRKFTKLVFASLQVSLRWFLIFSKSHKMLLKYLEFSVVLSALVAAHGSHSSHQEDDGETDWAVS